MFSIAGIDLLEQELLDHERTLLEILLQDKTTKKNIIWATDDCPLQSECIPLTAAQTARRTWDTGARPDS